MLARCTLKKIVWVLILLSFTMVLYANGQQEDRLKEAKALLEAKEYEQALLILSDISRNNPERRAEMQIYFDDIMRKQARINTLQENIITELYKNQDVEKAFILMEELKELAPKKLDFVREAYEGIRIVKILKEFNGYMDAAYQYLVQSQFREAIDTYRKGFTLQRDEFFQNARYGNIAHSGIQALFLEFDALIADYYARAEAISRKIFALGDLYNESRFREALAAGQVLDDDLLALLSVRARLLDVGKRIIAQNENIKKMNENGDGDNFLFYSYQVILGRLKSPVREGAAFVVERHWEILQEQLVALFEKNSDQLFASAGRLYSTGSFNDAESSFISAGSLYSQAASVLGQYVNTVSESVPFKLDKHDHEVLEQKLPLYYYFVERAFEARQYRNLMSSQKIYENLKNRPKTDDAVIIRSRAEIRDIVDNLMQHADFWKSRAVYFENLAQNGLDVSKTSGGIPEIIARVSALLSDYQKLDLEYSVIFAQREFVPLRDSYADKEKSLSQAKNFQEGIADAGTSQDLRKYPSRALVVYESLVGELEKLSENTRAFITKWTQDYDYVTNNPGVKDLVNKTRDIEKNIAVLRSMIDSQSSLARQQVNKATRLRNEGENWYKQAKEAFARKDYDQTRSNLNQSITSLTASLQNEENPQVRDLLENELVKFDREIFQTSQNQRIAEIRSKTDEAIQYYYLGIFDQAEKSIKRAEALQKELTGEEDTEIKYWLDLIVKALTVRPMREIPEKDPLYAEMTKKFNLAMEDYKTGFSAVQNGQTDTAKKSFKNVEVKLDDIQKSFPYHKDSGVLRLRILQQQYDRERFQETLRQKMQSAVSDTNNTKALADLYDIKEIDPNLPGLNEAIIEKEIKAGTRIKPPDPADIAQSYDLYREALATYGRGGRENYKRALALCNQALSYNPNNYEARNLKERILTELGGGNVDYPISPADQQLLLRAEALVAGRQYDQANEIVQQLLSNLQNRNNPRILTLLEKIRSRR